MKATHHLKFIFGFIFLLGITEHAKGIPNETTTKAEVDNVKKVINESDPKVSDDTKKIPKITTPKAKSDNAKQKTTASDSKDLNGNNFTRILLYFMWNISETLSRLTIRPYAIQLFLSF